MRLNIFTLLFPFLFVTASFAQRFEKVYDHTEKEPLIRLIEKEDAELYLAGNGHFLVRNTSEIYELISGKTGEVLAGGDHIKKNNKSFKVASLLAGNGRRGQMVEDVSFNEGTGFYAFEDDNVVLFLDWNLDLNILKAFDSETGELLWESDQYRFSPGKDKQMAAVLATIAMGHVANHTFTLSAMMAEGVFRSVKNQQTKNYGSYTARSYITPLEGTGSFMLKTGKEHICLDLRTGEEKWVYKDYPVNIADYQMVPGKNEVVLVNFNPSYWKKSENLIFKLDTETGEELLRIENLNNFVEDRTFVEGDRLVLDYYGVEVYDLNTGKKILLTIDEKVVKAANVMSTIIGEDGDRNSTAWTSPSWVEDGILYAGTEKRGARVYPVVEGSRKPKFTAYDLQTGKELWTTTEQQRGSKIIGANEQDLILESLKGLKKSYLVAVDKGSGEARHETEPMKQYLFRDKAGFIIGDEKILFSTKDGIFIFDEESLKHEKTLDVEEAGIGKAQAFGRLPDGFFVVADKGVGFYDKQGNYKESIEIKKVQSAVWTDETLVLMNKKALVAVDLNQKKASSALPLTETILSSYNLKHWMFNEDNKTEKYTLLE